MTTILCLLGVCASIYAGSMLGEGLLLYSVKVRHTARILFGLSACWSSAALICFIAAWLVRT